MMMWLPHTAKPLFWATPWFCANSQPQRLLLRTGTWHDHFCMCANATITLNTKYLSEESNKTTPPICSFEAKKTGQEMKICMPKALLSCFIPADYKHFKRLSLILPSFSSSWSWRELGMLSGNTEDKTENWRVWFSVGWGGKGPLNWKTDTGLEKTHIAVHWKVSLHLTSDFIWTVFWILNEAIWKWPAKYKIIILN